MRHPEKKSASCYTALPLQESSVQGGTADVSLVPTQAKLSRELCAFVMLYRPCIGLYLMGLHPESIK